jgi:hypothetical protein
MMKHSDSMRMGGSVPNAKPACARRWGEAELPALISHVNNPFHSILRSSAQADGIRLGARIRHRKGEKGMKGEKRAWELGGEGKGSIFRERGGSRLQCLVPAVTAAEN